MNEYKKIIKSQKTRQFILKMLFWIPTKVMLRIQYRIKLKRKLNLKNPKRFTEIIQLYKFKYKDDKMKTCVDKYEVRKYLEEKNLQQYLVELYGVYNEFEEINVNDLPEKFVIKTTNGSGSHNVQIYKNKQDFNIDEAKRTIGNYKKKTSKYSGGREWAYFNLKPKLIIEEYLENKNNPEAGIEDFKFFCFNGTPHYVVVDVNRFVDHKRNVYDANWKFLDVSTDVANIGDVIDKPKNFEKMLEVASILSKDFPFTRIDLYNLNGSIKFGEITFYPWSGYVQFTPDDFDLKLGELFNKDRLF